MLLDFTRLISNFLEVSLSVRAGLQEADQADSGFSVGVKIRFKALKNPSWVLPICNFKRRLVLLIVLLAKSSNDVMAWFDGVAICLF